METGRPQPTIKGLFVKSHIRAVHAKRGENGVRELERKFGKSLRFKNLEDVPVRDEVRLIDLSLDFVEDGPIPADERGVEAGRVHFRNFTTTPLGHILLSVFRTNFKKVLLQAGALAEQIFKGIRFSSRELGPAAVEITLENNDYPVDHFKGLFEEWLLYSGLKGTVEGKAVTPTRYVYTVRWDAL